MSHQDSIEQLIERAVENAVRKALEGRDAGVSRLLTVEETAVRLALSRDEVYNMIATEELTSVRRGRRHMLDIHDVDRWIERNKTGRSNGRG